MSSLLRSIRLAISNLIAPTQAFPTPIQGPKVTQLPYMGPGMSKERSVIKTADPTPATPRTPIYGSLTADQISTLESERIKSSIYQLGAWMQLSTAFNMYANIHGNRKPSPRQVTAFENAANEFHQWMSRLESMGQSMDLEETVARMAIPKAPRTNPETDAILARIRGKDVEQIAADRMAKAEQDAKRKEELIDAFIAEINGYAFGDEGNPTIKAAQALAKAEQVILWVAEWNNPDIAELIVAEADLQTLKGYARREELAQGAGEESRELDNQLLDQQGMRQGAGR